MWFSAPEWIAQSVFLGASVSEQQDTDITGCEPPRLRLDAKIFAKLGILPLITF
jgi:hypothetical protein